MSHIHFPPVAAFVAAIAIVLACAACSSGSKSQDGSSSMASGVQAASSSVNPCSLLSTQQISDATGVKFGPGKRAVESLTTSNSCTWSVVEQDLMSCPSKIQSVVLVLVAPPAEMKAQFPTDADYYPQMIRSLKDFGHPLADVSGVGDKAFETSTPQQPNKGYDLFATKGSAFLRIFSLCGEKAKLAGPLQDLMKLALAKT